jgi:hypothetical protein
VNSLSKAQKILEGRKKARADLNQLFDQSNLTIVIHYSCESFYDRPDGFSPMITSIAVRNLHNAQTTSFSIHLIAEKQKIDFNDIETHYDRLETSMLDAFYDYVRKHSQHRWLHWNMRDVKYGFPAIAHRYQVLGGTAEIIPEERLFDLPRMLWSLYGPGYAHKPHLFNTALLNKISMQDFLPGEEEAEAFEQKEYVKLHQSTLRKVAVITSIAEMAWSEDLRVNTSWFERNKKLPSAWIEVIESHPVYRIITIVGTIIAFFSITLDFHIWQQRFTELVNWVSTFIG